MKLSSPLIILLGSIAINTQVNAGNSQDPTINYSLHNSDKTISNTYLSSEAIYLDFTISVAADDIGKAASLFLVANRNDQWFSRTLTGEWQSWDKQIKTLQPFKSTTLQREENISVLNKQSLSAGEYLIYAGYRSSTDQAIRYNTTPASFIVFDENSPALHKINNKPLLASFFALGSSSSTQRNLNLITTAEVADAQSSSTFNVSQTNLQEANVDESDRIKTDGEYLYTLESCDDSATQQCITAYSINPEPATNNQLSQLNMEIAQYSQGSLYLSDINNVSHLIHISNSFTASVADTWFYPVYWQNNQTDIKFINVDQPEAMQKSTHITLDTSLLSSRLINGILYLVTRQNAYFNYPTIDTPDLLPIEDNLIRTADFTVPENQSIDDLLPSISFNDGSGKQLVAQATDCFIPSQNSQKSVDNTVITITAIPLDNPKAYYASCIVGAVDTFYMSEKSLYLATSRYPITIFANEITFQQADNQITTEIHKFTLGDGQLEYRGSGSVPGHLGWSADKQSFRMGEYNDVLKIATSKGQSWDNTSTTRVSVLKESDDAQRLEQISFLDNLGKPGEQLFAARFIQNRGYLVTFKQTDPLYVLDFSQPEQPKVLGELEVSGYSDYLHPIGENYLLGIGKDAIENTDSDFQGAFYQGVKLSLFDVTDGNSLREIQSIVIGKRGTESSVLNDHHALAWLATGDTATLAIPVQLHDQESEQNLIDYSQPQAYYNWTQTGLYTFKINTGANPDIELQGKLITDQAANKNCKQEDFVAFSPFCIANGQSTSNDRAVIQENSVHYIHNNAVFSSSIDDLI